MAGLTAGAVILSPAFMNDPYLHNPIQFNPPTPPALKTLSHITCERFTEGLLFELFHMVWLIVIYVALTLALSALPKNSKVSSVWRLGKYTLVGTFVAWVALGGIASFDVPSCSALGSVSMKWAL